MILSISEAAKRFKISRSKIYRMRDNGKISFTKKSDDTTGIDLSEMIRVFDSHVSKKLKDTQQVEQNHDIATENFYLKREIEALKNSLQKSEARVDQMIALSQEQTKQLLLIESKSEKSFWHRLWSK